MMKVCNHEILPEHIIGISPLFVKRSADSAIERLYKNRSLYFDLHLQNYSLRIESEVHSFAEHIYAADREKSQAYLDQFKKSYDETAEWLNTRNKLMGRTKRTRTARHIAWKARKLTAQQS